MRMAGRLRGPLVAASFEPALHLHEQRVSSVGQRGPLLVVVTQTMLASLVHRRKSRRARTVKLATEHLVCSRQKPRFCRRQRSHVRKIATSNCIRIGGSTTTRGFVFC